MARLNRNAEPTYCHHKARDLGYVRIDGRVVYLGQYNSPESLAEYDRLVGLWRLSGRRLPADALTHRASAVPAVVPALDVRPATPTLPPAAPITPALTPLPVGTTVTELVDAYLAEAEREYPPRDGKRNSELASIESALFSLNKLYGPTPANQVKPVYLETVMQDYVARGFCRKMVSPDAGAALSHPKFYTFVRMEPDGQGGFVPAQPYAEYKGAARRLNDDDGQVAPCDSIVRMTFVGYDGIGQPIYVFAHDLAEESAYLRPHDHRDNYPWSGGFAFAVYAPGTAVPQQPWAI